MFPGIALHPFPGNGISVVVYECLDQQLLAQHAAVEHLISFGYAVEVVMTSLTGDNLTLLDSHDEAGRYQVELLARLVSDCLRLAVAMGTVPVLGLHVALVGDPWEVVG